MSRIRASAILVGTLLPFSAMAQAACAYNEDGISIQAPWWLFGTGTIRGAQLTAVPAKPAGLHVSLLLTIDTSAGGASIAIPDRVSEAWEGDEEQPPSDPTARYLEIPDSYDESLWVTTRFRSVGDRDVESRHVVFNVHTLPKAFEGDGAWLLTFRGAGRHRVAVEYDVHGYTTELGFGKDRVCTQGVASWPGGAQASLQISMGGYKDVPASHMLVEVQQVGELFVSDDWGAAAQVPPEVQEERPAERWRLEGGAVLSRMSQDNLRNIQVLSIHPDSCKAVDAMNIHRLACSGFAGSPDEGRVWEWAARHGYWDFRSQRLSEGWFRALHGERLRDPALTKYFGGRSWYRSALKERPPWDAIDRSALARVLRIFGG